MPVSRTISRPAGTATARRRRRAAATAALTAVMAAAALTGCSIRDDICSDGEYPVLAVGNTGSACVTDGEQPPEGWARYPEGKVPKQVDDEWDVYWRTHTLDENGKIIDVPDAG